MKSILLFPGAFNPPHNGHVLAVEYALKVKNFDEVWIMPSGKRIDKVISTDFKDRRSLGNLFVEFLQSKLSVPVKLITTELDQNELLNNQQNGQTFTHEIMKDIKATPGVEITQLIGSDGFTNLYKKIGPVILDEKFLIINRPSYSLPNSVVHSENITIIENAISDISSTQIRNIVSTHGDSYMSLVPETIAQYLRENDLYN